MPSCRIWPAKRICKNRRKYVYYLHMGSPCGFLWPLDASKPLDFHDLLFFAITFSISLSANLIFSFCFYEKVLPAAVGSTILDMGTHHFGAPNRLFGLFTRMIECILVPFLAFCPSTPARLDFKNRRKYVYYFYNSLLRD